MGELDRLVQALDALGPRPSLRELERVLGGAKLDSAALAGCIRTDPRRYHRQRIVLREAYELLVMTWLPGQSSVPHDHGGSICALRVVQGTAQERTYELGDDGLVRPCFHAHYPTGQLVAGDDAAIHSVHNASADGATLVTVHVYSPPLRDFRRFMERPAPPSPSSPPDKRPVVAVVGGGFSGSMVAANLLRHSRSQGGALEVHLIDRRGIVGEGVAYGTREAAHRLNVPASGMAAWPDLPGDFLDWATRRDPQVRPYDFLPRRDYGDYVRQTLETAARGASASRLHVHADEARRVVRDPSGRWMVHAGRGASIACDAVVLATGHRTPRDPFEGCWQGPRHRFVEDPWQPFAVADITPEQPVVVIGSGLTAVDVVLSLAGPGAPPRTAPIWVLSRSGLLPRPHASAPVTPIDMSAVVQSWERSEASPGIRALLHQVRKVARSAPDWRSAVDGLRPHTQRVWNRLDLAQRRRFIRHVRSVWEVHRHRTAPQVAGHLAELESAGIFKLMHARLQGAVAEGDRVSVQSLVRAAGQAARSVTLEAAWVVNCSGPSPSSAPTADPAIASLSAAGLVRSDALGLGLETDAAGHAVDQAGRTVERLMVVGTLRKAQLWESTAVPELRVQAADAARALLHALGVPAA